MVSVRVKRNSAPQGEPESTDNYELVKDFVTRKAPFDVYDITAPMQKSFCVGGRLGVAFRFTAERETTPGVQNITVTIQTEKGTVQVPVTLNVHKAVVPPLQESKLIFVNWVHPNNLATYLGCERYSAPYYQL